MPVGMDLEAQGVQEERRRRLAIFISIIISQIVHYYNLLFLTPTAPIPYHTSILTGEGWMLELLNGHPERIRTCLGVSHGTFNKLVRTLVHHGFTRSRNGISIEEQLGIFLYTCVTGMSTRHVGERFQHSTDTISRYFKQMLFFFSDAPFYTDQVKSPTSNTPVSPVITKDPRFHFFHDCIGAVDGTHIRVFAATEDHPHMLNRKGYLSQNCLFACNFEFFFTYALTGWDGSTADATLWNDAHTKDLWMPHGKYLLGDAGFGTSDALLVPYRGVRYHLNEWRQANLRPQNREELFNLRHAALRNVIERIFGVLKRQFRVLQVPLEYNMEIQARLPAALCALHNFIHRHDPDDFFDLDPFKELELGADEGDAGVLGDGPADAAERRRADDRRDHIAQAMWEDYQQELIRRGL